MTSPFQPTPTWRSVAAPSELPLASQMPVPIPPVREAPPPPTLPGTVPPTIEPPEPPFSPNPQPPRIEPPPPSTVDQRLFGEPGEPPPAA